jgi:hypothetical protein
MEAEKMANQESNRLGPEAGRAEQRTTPGAQVVASARANVEALLAAFVAGPGGEAGEMARTLLFNSMLKEQTQQEEQTLRRLQEHRHRGAVLVEDLETMAVQRLNADARSQGLAEALLLARVQRRRIAQCVVEAQQASKEKRSFDYDRALNQISAVIGLRGGEEFLHSEVEGTPDYGLTAEEHRDFPEGRGPAWEEEQRRIRERDQKRSTG